MLTQLVFASLHDNIITDSLRSTRNFWINLKISFIHATKKKKKNLARIIHVQRMTNFYPFHNYYKKFLFHIEGEILTH